MQFKMLVGHLGAVHVAASGLSTFAATVCAWDPFPKMHDMGAANPSPCRLPARTISRLGIHLQYLPRADYQKQ